MHWRVSSAEVIDLIERHCRVQDASGGQLSVPMVLNRGQREALKLRAARLEDGTWLVTIKTRQGGSTTLWLCLASVLLVLCPGISIVFATTDDVLKGPIKPKWQIIWQSVQDSMGSTWPGVEADNDKTFRLRNGSRIMWVPCGLTAKKASTVSIGDTAHFAILSELSKWPYADRSLAALLPVLKLARAPIVVDSTAPENPGEGEDFLEIARLTLNGELPERDILFWPWFWVDEYRADTPASGYDDDELALVSAHGLDPFQVQWRREMLRNPETGKTFFQLYPETPEQALTRHHDSAFGKKLVEELRKKRLDDFEQPLSGLAVWEKLPKELRFETPIRDIFCEPQWGHAKIGRGFVRIWRPPQPGRRYWIGVDPSLGAKHSDFQNAVVLDDAGEHCATIRVRVPIPVWSSLLQRMALWYGAKVSVEMSIHGGEGTVFHLQRAIPQEDIARLRLHPISGEPFPERLVHQRTASSAHRVERQDAFIEYYTTGGRVRDLEVAREIMNLDPETREKPAKSRGHSDDYLDSIGIASCARKVDTYRPTPDASSGPPVFGVRTRRTLQT